MPCNKALKHSKSITADGKCACQQAQAELESGARQKQQDIDELHEQHRQAVRELQAEVERENGAARAANIAVQQRQARCALQCLPAALPCLARTLLQVFSALLLFLL